MNKPLTANTVKLIILITSASLIGLIGTQLFWIRKAFTIAQGQFAHRADNALSDVVDELRDYADSSGHFAYWHEALNDTMPPNTILDVLDTMLLANLINKYVDYHNLDKNYYFAILRTSDDSILYRSKGYVPPHPALEPYRACLACLWKKEYFHLALYFPEKNRAIVRGLFLWLSLSFVFLMVVVLSFIYIIHTILKQKKLSEMKNDFINNMTHEFKTPISTISIAAEVLLKSGPKSAPERIKKYSGIIFEENQRLKSQVERVMQLSLYNSHEIQISRKEIDLHELLTSSINNLCLEKCDKDVDIHYELNAQKPVIEGDEMHLRNIFVNIVENAVKYAGSNPKIRILTTEKHKGIEISFIDNGIGISAEDQRYIFDKFYRVHTGDLHSVKGSGIGLYYVKTMAEAHGGFVKVVSELNKGSRFDVYLPRHPKT